jgi:hypothetical protein
METIQLTLTLDEADAVRMALINYRVENCKSYRTEIKNRIVHCDAVYERMLDELVPPWQHSRLTRD